MLEFLADIETEAREARRQQMAEYRSLLTRAIPPSELDTEEQHRLAALIQQLGLKPDDVHGHARLLQEIERIRRQDQQLATLQDQRTAEQPALSAFIERRTQAIAALDAEGAPIFARCADLERQIQALQVRGAGDANAITRIHRDHAEFFAYDAPVRPRATEAQIAESQRRSQVYTTFRAVAATLLKTGKRDPEFSDEIQDSITLCLRFGQEQTPDPMVFRPADGWPTVEGGFSPTLIADPRRGRIMKLARRMLAGLKDGSIDWGQCERDPDIRRGVYLNWLDATTYQPLPNPNATDTTDEPADQEAPQVL